MSSLKKRNHYIPRVLLNRFASWSDHKRKKYKIWSFPRDGAVKELSTKDVGLGTHFYGKEDSKLEDRLSTIEARLGSALKSIEQGQPISDFNNFLSEYAWVQAIRTRSFRERFGRTMTDLLFRFRDTTATDAAKAASIARGEVLLAQKFAKLSPRQMEIARKKLGGASPREFASSYLKRLVESGELGSQMSEMLQLLSQSTLLTQGIAEGHNAALSEMLSDQKVSPDKFRAAWRLVEFPNDTLVLGDSCIFTLDANARPQPISDAVNWNVLNFPIGPTKCLVGTREESSIQMQPHEINRASASCSTHQFFASVRQEFLVKLIPVIDSRTEILSEAEKEDIVRSAWKG